MRRPIRRALLSVTDKTGLLEFAAELRRAGATLLSTGGTARALQDGGVEAVEISDYTGFPELMDGRLKTLHPKVHGGLLARDQDAEAAAAHDIDMIDLLVVNLYRFEEAAARPDADDEAIVEQIDIGGPAMLRAAAKNHDRVTVVCDPADYAEVAAAARDGGAPRALRRRLAQKAFQLTARYDAAIANWLAARDAEDAAAQQADARFPETLRPALRRVRRLRYGENPHQQAALYADAEAAPGGVAGARLLQGKEPSFNNLLDADAAWRCVGEFEEQTACAIIKHAGPCGVACADDATKAYRRAYAGDPVAAFGGVIGFNRPPDAATAEAIIGTQFVEAIVAPDFGKDALAVFAAKPALRLLACGPAAPGALDWRGIAGGLLAQDADARSEHGFEVRSRRAPGDIETRDLRFAWRVVKHVKSNAIVVARGLRTEGVGGGQPSRVASVRLAVARASNGAVMASDAFLPFRDGLDVAHRAGVVAVIQPGGSIHDDEIVAAADELSMTMVFTGVRHFRH